MQYMAEKAWGNRRCWSNLANVLGEVHSVSIQFIDRITNWMGRCQPSHPNLLSFVKIFGWFDIHDTLRCQWCYQTQIIFILLSLNIVSWNFRYDFWSSYRLLSWRRYIIPIKKKGFFHQEAMFHQNAKLICFHCKKI